MSTKRSKLDETRGDGHPEGGVFRARAGPIRPDLSQDARVLRLHDHRQGQAGREEAIRAYGKTIEETIAASPEVLAPLKLHYLRWVLFDIGVGPDFMYQGIFDTDFDKYTEDAVALFSADGHQHGLREPRRASPRTGRRTRRRSSKFVREHQCPSFLEYGEYPVRHRRRDQEGAAAQGRVLRHARPDAVRPREARDRCSSSTTSSTSC